MADTWAKCRGWVQTKNKKLLKKQPTLTLLQHLFRISPLNIFLLSDLWLLLDYKEDKVHYRTRFSISGFLCAGAPKFFTLWASGVIGFWAGQAFVQPILSSIRNSFKFPTFYNNSKPHLSWTSNFSYHSNNFQQFSFHYVSQINTNFHFISFHSHIFQFIFLSIFVFHYLNHSPSFSFFFQNSKKFNSFFSNFQFQSTTFHQFTNLIFFSHFFHFHHFISSFIFSFQQCHIDFSHFLFFQTFFFQQYHQFHTYINFHFSSFTFPNLNHNHFWCSNQHSSFHHFLFFSFFVITISIQFKFHSFHFSPFICLQSIQIFCFFHFINFLWNKFIFFFFFSFFFIFFVNSSIFSNSINGIIIIQHFTFIFNSSFHQIVFIIHSNNTFFFTSKSFKSSFTHFSTIKNSNFTIAKILLIYSSSKNF